MGATYAGAGLPVCSLMPLSGNVDPIFSSSILQAMSWILIVVGALLTIIGLVMIPLPGPGFILLFPGAVILAAGVALRMSKRLSQR
jgi:uncharacterized membrane protein